MYLLDITVYTKYNVCIYIYIIYDFILNFIIT